jgi:hypothetical protein
MISTEEALAIVRSGNIVIALVSAKPGMKTLETGIEIP